MVALGLKSEIPDFTELLSGTEKSSPGILEQQNLSYWARGSPFPPELIWDNLYYTQNTTSYLTDSPTLIC